MSSNHRSHPRTSDRSDHDRRHRDVKDKQPRSSVVAPPPPSIPLDEDVHASAPGAGIAVNGASAMKQRKFRDKHHPVLRAIWDTDKDEISTVEKLRKLEDVIIRQHVDPSVLCDVLDDMTGKPIAQATPLIIACFEGDPDIIRFLIEAGADSNQNESEHHLTPIHVLCDAEYYGQCLRQKDRADLVKLMIKRGANVNHLDRNAMTALHKAVIHDRPECVQALLDAKADPNVVYMGDTAISIAARHNRIRICQMMLGSSDTKVNHKNDQGGAPLHFASAAIVDSPECVELLLSAGARVNLMDIRRNTAAMVATFFCKPKILTTLIRAGADLSIQNNEGRTAYEIAKEKEHDDCLQLINKYSSGGTKESNSSSRRSDDYRDKQIAEDMGRMKIRK